MKRTLSRNKKGTVWDGIFTLVMIFAGIALAGFIASSLSVAQESQRTTYITSGCNSTNSSGCNWAYNASGYALQGGYTVSQQLPTVGNIGVVVVVITLIGAAIASLFVYFRTKGQ